MTISWPTTSGHLKETHKQTSRKKSGSDRPKRPREGERDGQRPGRPKNAKATCEQRRRQPDDCNDDQWSRMDDAAKASALHQTAQTALGGVDNPVRLTLKIVYRSVEIISNQHSRSVKKKFDSAHRCWSELRELVFDSRDPLGLKIV